MALTKTRKIGKLINANRKFIAFDSDQISLTYSKGSTGTGGTGTTLVVATIDDLPLVTTEGNKALVSSTNTLYLYNNGWYKIAIVNRFNPQWITEPDSEYTLDLTSIDSDLIITVYATDSDDVPITYTAVIDSDFNVAATITHDSDKDNRWVVSRVDSDTGAGTTGGVVFKASDGINLVQKQVSFIIPSNGASYVNLKSPASTYALGTTSLTFNSSTKYEGSHSAYITGNGTVNRRPGYNQGSATSESLTEYTISMWVNVAAWQGSYDSLFPWNVNNKSSTGNSYGSSGMLIKEDGLVEFCTQKYSGSAYAGITLDVGTLTTGTWYHIVAAAKNNGGSDEVALYMSTTSSFANLANQNSFSNNSSRLFTASNVENLTIGNSASGWYLHGSAGTASDGGNAYYDDVRIYNTKLTSAQAQSIYNSAGDVSLSTNPSQNNLIYRYGFNNTANNHS